MGKIQKLPPNLIAKIAAGEVIERPAYAVKELIENAIDAQADFIKIEIEKSGLEKISVYDNGQGMDYEDIKQCFKPHTTSKIIEDDDLHSISTLGFRGEALSSIASVSRIYIKSKTAKDTAGTSIEILAGKVQNISPVGIPVGTSIVVNNLFHNVPARKKFLKSPKTESSHIIEIVINAALSNPNLKFSFSHNKKLLFDLPKTKIITERICVLLGKETFNHLIPIKYEDSYLKISGFIAKPQLSSSTQNKNYIFINQRKVNNKLISQAVKEAYGNLIESTNYPVFILYITLPYEMVDVNIHPRKEQVSFVNNRFVFEVIKKAVSQTLLKNNLTYHNLTNGLTQSYAGLFLKEKVTPWSVNDIGQIIKSSDIIQIHNTYLIIQTKKGLLVIDQHAAHERILYEQFIKEFQNQKNEKRIFNLPKSIPLDLSFSEAGLLEENIDILKKLGFEIEHFKDNIFKINTVPLLFKDRQIKQLLLEILEDISENKKPAQVDKQSLKMIEYLACRSAIKAGQELTKKEAKKLLEELEKTNSSYTCPHGRPVKIEISLNELSKYFKRV